MARVVVVFLVALLGVSNALVQADRDSKNRPISKVVTLLKDMVSQLQKESEEDKEVYEAMGCWCETNDKSKTKAIADAGSRILKLNAEIEKQAGASSQLNTAIENHQAELAKDQEALDTATALREKQLAEFTEEEKDMMASIGSVGSALNTLSKHHVASSLLQSSVYAADAVGIVTTIHDQLRRHKDLLAEVISPQQRRMLAAFMDPVPGAQFLQQGSGYNPEYKPQSGQILGVLGQMKETFETNLAKSQEEEEVNSNSYEDLRTAKTAQIKAGQGEIEAKTALMAEADEKHAHANQDLTSTEATKEADEQYLAKLKEHCSLMDEEFEQREKTRQLEAQAVSKALAILSSDEATDLVSSSLGLVQQPRLLQLRSRRSEVAERIQAAGMAAHDPRLSMLARRVRIDAFTKVKETLQNMIDNLLKEKEDTIKQKDFCVDSLNQNLRTTEDTQREKADAIAKMEDHINAMDTLTKAIEADKASITELRVELKKETEDREKANSEFQQTVADQRATQKLVSSALDVLKGFYESPALVQAKAVAGKKQEPAGPPPPPGFKTYSNNAASGGVMNMLKTIIDDAKAMEAEAIKGEHEAQEAYEAFVESTNAAVLSLQKDIAIKTEQHAREEQGKVFEETTRDEKTGEIEQLMKENLDLHYSCDYLIKNFDIKMEARDDEIEALKQGLATFSGATFSSLLQETA